MIKDILFISFSIVFHLQCELAQELPEAPYYPQNSESDETTFIRDGFNKILINI